MSAEQKEIIGKDGVLMVLIPAGEFLMGSPAGKGHFNEYPQHKVFLSAYYIDKYEVTVAQYRKFCEATGRKMPSAPSWGWIDTHPVVNVFWYDAVTYAQYYGKCLPTEAEWEKACRAGTTTAFHYGDSLNSEQANFHGRYPYESVNKCIYRKQTTPVGSFQPNVFGLYDMHGNVWEWCSDLYDQNYYANSPEYNPQGATNGSDRVMRGGSWYNNAENCRSAYRGRGFPEYGGSLKGFRCAYPMSP